MVRPQDTLPEQATAIPEPAAYQTLLLEKSYTSIKLAYVSQIIAYQTACRTEDCVWVPADGSVNWCELIPRLTDKCHEVTDVNVEAKTWKDGLLEVTIKCARSEIIFSMCSFLSAGKSPVWSVRIRIPSGYGVCAEPFDPFTGFRYE